jgi:hypothetical protein
MGIFNRSTEFEVAWEAKPWWRSISLLGWTTLLFGLAATAFFVLGLFSGEVLFVVSPKAKSGPVQVSADEHFFWYWALMAANLVISVVAWGLFYSWLRGRKK